MSPLRRRMIEDMQIRNLTPNTQRVYVAQVVRFACHLANCPPSRGVTEIRTYLLHLIQERRLAASSVIVTVSALRFFYHTTLKRPWAVEDDIPTGRQAKKLPVVLSQEEVARFLGAVDNLKHRIILTICYATGLMISEAVRLRPGAIDSTRMVIRVEQGKGRKDRYVMNTACCRRRLSRRPSSAARSRASPERNHRDPLEYRQQCPGCARTEAVHCAVAIPAASLAHCGNGIDPRRQFYPGRLGGQSDCRAAGKSTKRRNRVLGILQVGAPLTVLTIGIGVLWLA